VRTGSNDLVVLRLGPNDPSHVIITSQEIPRARWRPYFKELTDVVGTVGATVEVIGHDIGDQIADERQVLTNIAYDDRDDVLIVGLEAPDSDVWRLEHMIEHPQRVLVATGEPPSLEVTFDVEDGEQHRWLIHLERPPALPGE
jgi:UDP-N-acetyl-D-mannosaminuronic acid transferase (WecB/TagA/CpsF family)